MQFSERFGVLRVWFSGVRVQERGIEEMWTTFVQIDIFANYAI